MEKIFRSKVRGACVDVGAHGGIELSNSYHFEQMGWDCVLVEANPALHGILKAARRKSRVFECAAAETEGTATFYAGEANDVLSTLSTEEVQQQRLRQSGGAIRAIQVPTRTLDSILAEAGLSAIDFVSIDVEGSEMAVMRGFSLARWRPRVLVIEDNSDFEDATLFKWMHRFGYKVFNSTGCNVWFANSGDAELVNWRSAVRVAIIRLFKRIKTRKRALLRPLKTRVKQVLGRLGRGNS